MDSNDNINHLKRRLMNSNRNHVEMHVQYIKSNILLALHRKCRYSNIGPAASIGVRCTGYVLRTQLSCTKHQHANSTTRKRVRQYARSSDFLSSSSAIERTALSAYRQHESNTIKKKNL